MREGGRDWRGGGGAAGGGSELPRALSVLPSAMQLQLRQAAASVRVFMHECAPVYPLFLSNFPSLSFIFYEGLEQYLWEIRRSLQSVRVRVYAWWRHRSIASSTSLCSLENLLD